MAKKKISKKVLAAIQDKLTLVSLASPREPDQFKDLVDVNPKYFLRMDQPYLKESKNSTAVISFGRMNPPTIGHQKLVDKVKEVARSKGGRPMIFLSHTQDSKKNPLGYSDKIKFARAAFGRDVVKPSSAKTLIDIANKLSREYDNLVMVVGDDRVREFDSLLNKYNGQDYSFETIEIVSAGTRDPDSSDVSGMSASKMRDFVSSDDMDSFRDGLPMRLQSQHKRIFDLIKKNLTESKVYTRGATASTIVSTKGGEKAGQSLNRSRAISGALNDTLKTAESGVDATEDSDETHMMAFNMAAMEATFKANKGTLQPDFQSMTPRQQYEYFVKNASQDVMTAANSGKAKYLSMLKTQQLPKTKRFVKYG
mgnify:CR=1 FL=1